VRKETIMEASEKVDADSGDAKARTHGEQADRLLSRARKTLDSNDWQPNGESEFLIERAKVEAFLELADAIRQGSRAS
jgi:hypothetical protein